MKCNSLEEVREQINQIDDAIIRLIAERGKYVVQASMFKKDEKSVVAPNRVEAVIEKVRVTIQVETRIYCVFRKKNEIL